NHGQDGQLPEVAWVDLQQALGERRAALIGLAGPALVAEPGIGIAQVPLLDRRRLHLQRSFERRGGFRELAAVVMDLAKVGVRTWIGRDRDRARVARGGLVEISGEL